MMPPGMIGFFFEWLCNFWVQDNTILGEMGVRITRGIIFGVTDITDMFSLGVWSSDGRIPGKEMLPDHVLILNLS